MCLHNVLEAFDRPRGSGSARLVVQEPDAELLAKGLRKGGRIARAHIRVADFRDAVHGVLRPPIRHRLNKGREEPFRAFAGGLLVA